MGTPQLILRALDSAGSAEIPPRFRRVTTLRRGLIVLQDGAGGPTDQEPKLSGLGHGRDLTPEIMADPIWSNLIQSDPIWSNLIQSDPRCGGCWMVKGCDKISPVADSIQFGSQISPSWIGPDWTRLDQPKKAENYNQWSHRARAATVRLSL